MERGAPDIAVPALLSAGAAYAALGVLDPRLPAPLLGPALAIAGLVLARRRGDRRPAALVLTVLTCVYALAGRTEPDFAADLATRLVGGRAYAADGYAIPYVRLASSMA